MAQPTSVPGHPSGIHGPRRPTHRPVAFSHTENIAKLFACHAPIMVSGCRPYPFASRDKLYPGSTPTLLAEPPRVRPGSLTEDNPWPHVCFPTWESPDPIEKHPWVTPTTYTPRVGRLLTTRSARPEPFASTVQRRIKSPTGFQAPPAGAMSGARPAPSARQLAAVALQYSPPPAPT